MKKILFLLLNLLSINGFAQPFVPKDTVLANNVFQVEFSDDGRSMVWCENLGGGEALVWYADVDLNTGFPNFATKQPIDTIKGQGWPYWGQDQTSKFFLIKNKYGHIKYIRRSGFNTLTQYNLGTVNGDVKSLVNVNSDSTKNYFWVNYVVKDPNPAITLVKDSLFVLQSNNPGVRYFVNAEFENNSGSAYELTFPRWLAQSEQLAYPFRPFPTQPYWDIKLWNGQTQSSLQATNDIPNSIFNHHVDDLPFRLPQFPDDTFMYSSKAAQKVAVYQKTGNYFTQIQLFTSPTSIVPTTLTSFEPFTICGNKTYGAYQVYSGGGIPGTTAGEIYLLSIFGDTTHIKISGFDGDVAVDPEYVIGTNNIWIFYYGKPTGLGNFNLHRCETPLKPCSILGLNDRPHKLTYAVYPNPFQSSIRIQNAEGNETIALFNSFGQEVWSGNNIEQQDFSSMRNGIYFLQLTSKTEHQIYKLIKK